MKKSWWSIPVYCMAASWVCFQLEIRFLGRWAIVTLPDGSISSDQNRWLLLSGILFLAVIAAGGLLFFRKQTRRELFYSASVLALLHVVLGLAAYKIQGTFSLFWIQLTEWNSFLSQLLYRLGIHEWICAAAVWLLTPYLFVPFGKRSKNAGDETGCA